MDAEKTGAGPAGCALLERIVRQDHHMTTDGRLERFRFTRWHLKFVHGGIFLRELPVISRPESKTH